MTRQQQWALRSHELVLALKERPDKAKQKTFGMKMPGLIQQSGLIQALVFVQTRGVDGQVFVNALATVYGAPDGTQLLTNAQRAPLPAYLALSRDMLDVSAWMRRFVQIEMKDVKEDSNDSNA